MIESWQKHRYKETKVTKLTQENEIISTFPVAITLHLAFYATDYTIGSEDGQWTLFALQKEWKSGWQGVSYAY